MKQETCEVRIVLEVRYEEWEEGGEVYSNIEEVVSKIESFVESEIKEVVDFSANW